MRGRPGGNPDLVKHQFSTEREEPCSAKLTLRLPPSQYAKLKEIDNWQEKVRGVIASLVEQESETDGLGK
ncbi:hypothetical protein MTo_01495 [Microcystis aeruginosa NIES-1211]|jgi:hypothetical protein|uniref:Uncharacterized protein n=1 Tax=Microcystis aeruginosa NIES-2519 TaxID=2303981 RepID=A0A5A5R3C9_MICAE|nr:MULTISPECIES: hypothetical protein [Microcystis]AVQ73798.1 hypothetical protein B5D77_23175 [Microcystis sp. MC19]GBL14198.1 hypothetical protein MTo_01495 [Microcystis aeruginosa NIES-1211]GCA69095.1 hypothetical protein MiYa_00617 [Microcystis aeruginosa NIES-2519]GCA84199.1 hypothetical protein MiHa_02170 [Microcystis aeruginosa NIES-2522]GCA90499.1 hypothetical protein MiTa_03859 [Microcystis aeruginosa NIES-4264]